MSPILSGIGWHLVGAASAAGFYAPISKVKKWSWETTWAVAGFFSWILLPTIVAVMLLPDYLGFYRSLDHTLVLEVMAFGAMWGVGNVSYGLTMRYMGMSLGIGTAIGVTLIIGTLMPPVLHGELSHMLQSAGGKISLVAVLVALVGVAIVTTAGHQKEKVLGRSAEEFNLTKGVFLAVLCGVFSSGMSFAIDVAKPIQALAETQGINPLYSALPSYVLIMGGGAAVNFAYCFVRLAFKKDLSLRKDLALPAPSILANGAMAATGGIMWYFQFFFYAWGAANIPHNLGFLNWMLHMSGYVLFGGIVGLALHEWRGVGRKPIIILWLGMAIIILAANLAGVGMSL